MQAENKCGEQQHSEQRELIHNLVVQIVVLSDRKLDNARVNRADQKVLV